MIFLSALNMDIIVESFRAKGEKFRSSIRVRPLPDQGFSTEMRVECSKQMREAHSVGQLFCLNVQLKSRLDSPDFLYCNYRET